MMISQYLWNFLFTKPTSLLISENVGQESRNLYAFIMVVLTLDFVITQTFF